ncbi:hypothetical protein NMY22_g19855 [Coprinellus aureogranulatus]|nr:hypothetical protein NMY22_g19855 [Coprinellus aureogranulatus]
MGIALASTYDQAGKHLQAFEVYYETLNQFLDPSSSADFAFEAKLRLGLSTAERLRAVAIGYKLSEMAHDHHMDGGEEKWLKWCTNTLKNDVFGVGLEPGAGGGEVSLGDTLKNREFREKLKKGLEMANWMPPMWRLTADLAKPFEALAKFYARDGRFDQAMPLYSKTKQISNAGFS